MHLCGRVLDRTECIGVAVCWIEQNALVWSCSCSNRVHWCGRMLDRTESIDVVVFLFKQSALVWPCVG